MLTPLEKAEQRQINFNIVFNSEKGKDVLIDLIEMCHILEPMATPDPYALAFREGERNIGLTVLKILNVTPEKYISFVKETIER